MWSLGCVFVEMCSVLAARSVKDMREFFAENGTTKPSIRENMQASERWCELLTTSLTRENDQQPLDVAQRMTVRNPDDRLTASDLTSLIFQEFEGPPRYYGLCCQPTSQPADTETIDTSTLNYGLEDSLSPGPALELESGPSAGVGPTEETAPTYREPIVEDEEETIEAFFHNTAPKSQAILEEITIEGLPIATGYPQTKLDHTPEPEPAASGLRPEAPEVTSQPRPADLRAAEKPGGGNDCDDDEKTITVDENHPAAASQTEPGVAPPDADSDKSHRANPGTPVMNESPRKKNKSDKHVTTPAWTKVFGISSVAVACPSPGCYLHFQHLGPGPTRELRTHLRRDHGVHEIGWTRLLEDDPSGVYSFEKDVYGERLRRLIKSEKKRRRSKALDRERVEQARRHAQSMERDPVQAGDSTKQATTSTKAIGGEEVQPNVKADLQSKRRFSNLPKSTRAPSYYWAANNLFTRKALSEMVKDSRDVGTPQPLFVYGCLMFPSVLRGLAASCMKPYALGEEFPNGLRTGSFDWAFCDQSIQSAAETMTPAVLKDFERLNLMGLWCAALKPSFGSEVSGFLIFGLSIDAIRCLDQVYSKASRRKLFSKGLSQDTYENDVFKRRTVKVSIKLSDGGDQSVSAQTYAWDVSRHDLHAGSLEAWDTKNFVGSINYHRFAVLDNPSEPSPSYLQEERQLAAKMSIAFVQSGDELCSAVLARNFEKIRGLIRGGYDVDLPCTTFGTVLQAASARGDVRMIEWLLDNNADINAPGGQFGTPLIAAIAGGHVAAVEHLLEKGARVLQDGGHSGSALYQAVDFQDLALVRILLDRGAWATPGYDRLLEQSRTFQSHDIHLELEKYKSHASVFEHGTD